MRKSGIDQYDYPLYNLTCVEVRVLELGFPLGKAGYEEVDKNER
jgi:hypothetical protein